MTKDKPTYVATRIKNRKIKVSKYPKNFVENEVKKFSKLLKNLNQDYDWNIPYGILTDELEKILEAQEANLKKRLKEEIGKRIVKNGLSRGGQRLMDLKEIEEIINKI